MKIVVGVFCAVLMLFLLALAAWISKRRKLKIAEIKEVIEKIIGDKFYPIPLLSIHSQDFNAMDIFTVKELKFTWGNRGHITWLLI